MILLIGSTGNIGKHVKKYLQNHKESFKEAIYKPTEKNDHIVSFDFFDETTYDQALDNISRVFFIRPPQIGNPKDIYPFIDACKNKNIKNIVFVSLMGVEKNPIPPHAKIEKYIKKQNINYTFIRPSFFMENLIYPHGKDIKNNDQIIIPAMKAKTSFVAAKDIGDVSGRVLIDSDKHINKAYTITGPKALTYNEVAQIFTKLLQRPIKYTNPSMRSYQKHMIENGFDKDYVRITKLLYFMTRLGTAKKITNQVENILKRPALTLEEFIKMNISTWQ